MRQLVGSEIRKLRATPTMWWLALGMVALTIAAVLATFALQETGQVPRTSDDALRQDLHAVGSGSILVTVAGMIGMAGEFRFGQADQTFISEPRRGRVLLAKVLVFAVLGLVFGIVASGGALATMWVWFSSNGDTIPFARSAVWLTLIGAVTSAVLFAVLGVAVGAIARNQVVAIVGAMVWLVVLEPILFQSWSGAAKWLPGQAGEALRRVPQEGLLSMGTGTLVLCAWIAAVLAAGHWRTRRFDIV
jgi:ABC-2 type transport system permease protein